MRAWQRIATALALMLAFGCVGAQAQTAFGYQQITSLSGATTLTIPAGTRWALICAEVAAVRWRDDGTNPTATVGMPLGAGTCFQYNQPPGLLIFIQQSSGAVLDISYYK